MSFVYQCPYCGQQIQGEEQWAGQQTQCPYCGQAILIPAPPMPLSGDYSPSAMNQLMGNYSYSQTVMMEPPSPVVSLPPNPMIGDMPTAESVRKSLGRVFLHMILCMIAFVGSVVFAVMAAAFTRQEEILPLVGIGLVGSVIWLVIEAILWGVFFLIWIFRSWKLLPPESRRCPLWGGKVSPGMAVGFLFIPVFNLYWFLVAFYGLPFAYKRYHGVDNGGCPVSITLMILQVVNLLNNVAVPILRYHYISRVDDYAMLLIGGLQALQGILGIVSFILTIILMCKVRTQEVKLVTEGATQFY